MLRTTPCGSRIYTRISLELSLLLTWSLLCGNGIVAVSSAASGPTRGRSQLVSVSAPWPTSCLSPLAEASEFVAESDTAGAFWDYVEAVGDAPQWLFSCGGSSSGGSGSGITDASSAEGATLAEHKHTNEAVIGETRMDHSGRPGVHFDTIMIEGGAVSAAAIRAAGEGFDIEGDGENKGGLGLDELSLKLLEVALSARSHAPAIESHRTLAALTLPECESRHPSAATPTVTSAATSSAAAAMTPAAWVVLLPGGHVACSPEILADALSGTCTAAGVTTAADGDDVGGAGEGSCPLSLKPTLAEVEENGEEGGGERANEKGSAEVIGRNPSGDARTSALAFDHVYNRRVDEVEDILSGTISSDGGDGGEDISTPETTAILYGTVGSPTMMQFHRVLKAAAEIGAVRYVFRHALPYGGEDGETTPLQGYGVVLDVKNMEYRNLDDSSEKEGASASAAADGHEKGDDYDREHDGLMSIVEGEEVGGVVLSTLAERRPELKRELDILRQALLLESQDGDDGGSEELKVWNMGDLGLQALQSVAGADDPLLRLEELSQNFPSHASALSALKVHPGARDEAQAGQHHFFSDLGLRRGSLYVNGKMLDLEGPTFNAFQILSMLRTEASLLGDLTSMGAPLGAVAGNRARSLLTAAGPVVHSKSGTLGGGGGAGWRVDVIGVAKGAAKGAAVSREATHPSPIVWLNDIEEDHKYKKWASTLNQLTYQSFQLPRVRRNLYNLVVVADPTTAAGAEAMQLLDIVVEQGVPVRAGLILTSQEDVDAVGDAQDKSWGSALDIPAEAAAVTSAEEEPPRAREIAELLSRLSEHASTKAALSFVREVAVAQTRAFTGEEAVGPKGGKRREGDGEGGAPRFRRRDLAEIFVNLAGKKGPLSESRAIAEPWTEAGASWGSSDGDAVLSGAWRMARLCSSKGLSVQTWSVNGVMKGTVAEIRTSLMQAIMQENILIARLFLEGLVSDTTKDIYSRVLKHCGAKVHRRIHPALTTSLADDSVVDLSSRKALDLVEGAVEDEGDPPEADVELLPHLPPLDWLHPPGTSDSAKGVSLMVVVDPLSLDGLRTLEQALSVLVLGGGVETGGGDGDDRPLPLPLSGGLRLSVVFNPSTKPSPPPGEGRSTGTTIGEVLPAILEAVESRSPDKVPRFLLAVVRAATVDSGGSGSKGSLTVDSIGDLAADAGLSPSLRKAVVDAVAAVTVEAGAESRDGEASVDDVVDGIGSGSGSGQKAMLETRRIRERERRASLARSVLSLEKGESCALVNGRRAIPARAGRALTAEDLSITIEAADDLGSFLVQEALAWDWGSWPEDSPQSSNPDLVNARLQSNVMFRLASFVWRYHQESRKIIPGSDVLSDGVARASSSSLFPDPGDDDNKDGSDKNASVRSVVHLVPGDDDGSGSDGEPPEGVEGQDGGGGGVGKTGPGAGRVDVEVVAVLDPLSAAAQRASTFLLLARDVLRLPVTLLLTPELEVSELPLKNFYRLVLGPGSASRASFDRLPTRDVLTQRLDTPEPWNVQASAAVQDLDNLRCDSAGCGDLGTTTTSAEYTLKGLLLTGRCYDVTTDNPSPPQGLQLVLRAPPFQGTMNSGVGGGTVIADTVVMSNLGYFQLQAAPGVWELALASGRASDVYEIVGVAEDDSINPGGSSRDGGSAPHRAAFEVERRLRVELAGKEASPATEAQAIVVRNFYSRYEPVLVRKRKGMEDVGLLEHEESAKDALLGGSGGSSGGSIWSSFTEVMGFGVKEGEEKLRHMKGLGGAGEEERVHVFSLATGHLYERLMKVMMMSVVKRCSLPVTFWLLENFLSPSFKESARGLAQDFGFRVEFVTYKWPEWLRRQSEKQRIIWGYKILFLDVLFPLHLDKVIYVDADQVVRADLKELWDLDLKGAPYGYTPFCSSREETLGYQFWSGGFWKNHLMGRSYHISALYVVDLKAFRRRAVGDSLRSMYNALSADPNSLSNLDQDLPNYAQHQVPIFSLPQEWLWCETWCSDESKAKAKTIDLCNNPQHKEPKLDMAKRVISGPLFKESWVELDAEVRAAEDARRGVREEGLEEDVTP